MPCPPSPGTRRRGRRGFTIIELLTVMAVLGILMAILIPVVGGARNSAKRAKTRVQFAQWATAIEGFRQEYGYYPDFTEFADGKIDAVNDTIQFVQTLTGRQLDGSAYGTGSPANLGLTAGNTKRIAFCSFSDSDLAVGPRLQDAFGNTQIVVLLDKNQDGLIRIGTSTNQDYATAPDVVSASGSNVGTPLQPNSTVRASVVFYSAGDGSTATKSWE